MLAQSLGWDNPLEERMATHSSILAWRTPWTEEPGGLQSTVAEWHTTEVTMNKVSGGDGIPVELLQILKHDAVKVLHSIYQQIWETQQWPQDWKRSFHSNPKERQCQRMLKLPHNCTHLTR